jgi:hypothetical protein
MAGFKSQGVSSQGTELSVQGAGGATVTAPITAITAASSAVITAANSFINGQVVTIDDVVGMVEINGLSGIASNVSPTGFTVAIDSTGFTPYVSGGTAEGNTGSFENICEARNFTGFDGQASEIDKTTMCSTAMEFVPGLQDFGAFNFTMNYVPTDPAQIIMQEAKAAGTTLWWKLTLPNDLDGNPMGAHLFQAFVRQMTLSGGVNAILESNVVLRITGEPTFIAGGAPLAAGDARRARDTQPPELQKWAA